MPNVASNEQNQCFTVAVGAQLTISNCLTRHKVYEMQSVDEMDPTGQAVFGAINSIATVEIIKKALLPLKPLTFYGRKRRMSHNFERFLENEGLWPTST